MIGLTCFGPVSGAAEEDVHYDTPVACSHCNRKETPYQFNKRAVSYTHLDVYKRQIYIITHNKFELMQGW